MSFRVKIYASGQKFNKYPLISENSTRILTISNVLVDLYMS